MFQTTNQDEKSQLEIWSTLRYSKYSNVACWKTVIEFEDFLINSIIDIGFSGHFLFIKGTTCLEQSLFDRFHNNGDVPLQTVKSHTGYAHICQIIVIINNPHHVCLSCFFQVKPPAIAIHFFTQPLHRDSPNIQPFAFVSDPPGGIGSKPCAGAMGPFNDTHDGSIDVLLD